MFDQFCVPLPARFGPQGPLPFFCEAMASDAPPAEHGTPGDSQALVATGAPGLSAAGGAPPLGSSAADRVLSMVATAMAELRGATKATLIEECHVAGVPATRRNTKAQLLDRLEAALTAMGAAAIARQFAARRRPAALPAPL